MDYEDLVIRLKAYAAGYQAKNQQRGIYDEAADAIENLLAERDAAVNDLREVADCTSCKFYDGDHPECANCGAFLEEWQWRGPQKD